MPYEPDDLPPDTPPFFDDVTSLDGSDPRHGWVPMFRHDCTFGPDLFVDKMMNMIRNPNLNSSWLFRADILHDDAQDIGESLSSSLQVKPIVRDIRDFACQRTLVRKLIPRNERRDQPMEQTCTLHCSSVDSTLVKSLVIYTPHVSSASELPFYHPKVRGIAHLHEWDPACASGSISVHFLPFQPRDHGRQLDDDQEQAPDEALTSTRLRRTAYHLLEILNKHGHSSASGYVKRVHHDIVVPQARFQDRYAALKAKYARRLVDTWAETTDPAKHVFEDLGIAAFLIELWADMYGSDGHNERPPFPGFVDIGCGNGLLVYILVQEGYSGWGFDARARKSWAQYQTDCPGLSPSGRSLEQRLLLPTVVLENDAGGESDGTDPEAVHDGLFPTGTFIISNHADELTPWTPILGAMSRCPFIMIPCCSHNLTGEKFRAPPPRDKSKPKSTYASLVDWITLIAEDCGWDLETEMLRIPSTRNTCLVGRRRPHEDRPEDMDVVLRKYGGIQGYAANVAKLLKSGPRGH
ncbi:tRNA (uracil-O(2)-)-methyltransferase [Hirsutella minnesotensis 3608]|nr:tRNA (uracil-O(2)-)-methyltransferase [Hirsutella minnesotensis 3608]